MKNLNIFPKQLVLNERFIMNESPFASGGFASVHLGYDVLEQKFVAVKTPLSVFDNKELIRYEAAFTIECAGPHTVEVLDIITIGGTHYMVMEYLPSDSTIRYRADNGNFLKKDEVKTIVHQLPKAFAPIHGKDTVHLDLTDGNVFFVDGVLKIIDFGICNKMYSDSVPPSIRLDCGMTVHGSLDYISPEAVKRHPTSAMSDIFSIGSILFRGITGRNTFTYGSDDVSGILQRRLVTSYLLSIRQCLVDAVSDYNNPEGFADGILRAMHRFSSRRQQSVAELSEELAPTI